MKFGRTYVLTVQPNPQTVPNSLSKLIQIQDPITLEMDVVRNVFASANTGTFRIYNLGPDIRRQIFHDMYDQGPQFFQQIELQAGYKSEINTPLATIFLGNIQWAYSYRQKEIWITYIQAYDGGSDMVSSQANLSLPTTTDPNYALRQLLQTMPNIAEGTLALPPTQNSRGMTLYGNSWDLFRRICGKNDAFIDLGKASATAVNEYVSNPGGISVISSDTGLLGTPRKSGALVEVNFIFEPRITIKQTVQLESQESYYNGQYQVRGIQHVGPISGAFCGQLTSKLMLWNGTGPLQMAEAA